MSSTASMVVGARVPPRHAEALRQLAYKNASTVSQTVARIIADRLDGQTVPTPNVETTDA